MASEGFQKDFIIYNPDRYNSVIVTGSWCNWSETGHPLTKIPGLYWIATVTLPYDQQVQYKYIINGNWQTDPDDKIETDGSGNTNNVFQVPAASALKGNLVGGTHDTKNEPIVERVIQNHAPALSSGTTVAAPTAAAPAASGASTAQNKDAPASHGVADVGVASAAAKAASAAGLGHDEHESRSADLAGPGASGSGLTHVPTGGAAAESGVAAAAAKAANKAGLGHDEHERSTGTSAAGPSSSGLSHVPAGGSVAQAGVAQDAANEAAKHGLGEDGSGVEGTTKVAPGVVQATPASSSVAGVSDTSLTQPGTSTRAPLPASTGDAPLAPESAHHGEGKGLFTVLGGLGAAAVAGATAMAHRVQEGDSPAAALKGPSSPAQGPAAALSPIASGDATSKITHDLAQVDLQHTKSEVVHGIERLGGVLAGGLAGLGSMIDGTDGRLGDSDLPVSNISAAKQGPALSTAAFGTAANKSESTKSTSSANNTAVGTSNVAPGFISNLLPASLASSFGAPDAQRTFAHTGGPVASAPLGSAATAPAVGDGSLPTHQTVNPVPIGTINNVAGAVGSSATARESPAVATSAGSAGSAGASAGSTGASASSASSSVPGLAINKTSAASGAATSAPQVPGLSINGSGTTTAASAASAPAATNTSSTTSSKRESIADKLKSGVGAGSSKKDDVAGGSGTSAPVGDSENATAAGRAIGEDKPSVQAGQAEPATSGIAATPASTISKKDTSALGKGQPGAAPATPKKSGHGAEASSSTPASEGYKTAPSTPATPVDRKRKSSIFNKIKSAFSPAK